MIFFQQINILIILRDMLIIARCLCPLLSLGQLFIGFCAVILYSCVVQSKVLYIHIVQSKVLWFFWRLSPHCLFVIVTPVFLTASVAFLTGVTKCLTRVTCNEGFLLAQYLRIQASWKGKHGAHVYKERMVKSDFRHLLSFYLCGYLGGFYLWNGGMYSRVCLPTGHTSSSVPRSLFSGLIWNLIKLKMKSKTLYSPT